MINLHKPHPGNELKVYAKRQVIRKNGGPLIKNVSAGRTVA